MTSVRPGAGEVGRRPEVLANAYRGGQAGSDPLEQAKSRLAMRLTREHQVVPASVRA